MRLTIAIPTYNRREALRRTLEIILPQLQAEVELLVVDNASDYDAESLLGFFRASNIRYMRHDFNLGLAANILKCYENAAGDWVWILGDDDSPDSGAVDRILADLRDTDHARTVALVYSYGVYRHDKAAEVTTFEDLAVDRYFGGLTFISTVVHNRRKEMRHLSFGYDMAYTCAPHFAILLACFILDKGAVKLFATSIVEPHGSEVCASYNYLKVKTRFLTFLELPFLDNLQRKVLYEGVRKCTYPGFMAVLTDFAMIVYGEYSGTFKNQDARFYHKEWFSRYLMWRPFNPLLRAALYFCMLLRLFSPLIVRFIDVRRKRKGRGALIVPDLHSRI